MKMPNEICCLANNDENYKNRYMPFNAKSAHCFQLHDTLRILYGVSKADSLDAWSKQLDILESQIKIARLA